VTSAQSITLKAIVPGYAFSYALNFLGPDGEPISGFDLTTADRLRAEFRRSIDDAGPPLAVVDTEDDSIVVVDANTIQFSLAAEATARMEPGSPAWVDFTEERSGSWAVLTPAIPWPVRDAVTVPPTPALP